MKTTTDDQNAVQDCKFENGMLNYSSENKAENMDPFKSSTSDLSSEKESSINSHYGLISAFGNLDLDGSKVLRLLNLDYVSDKAIPNEDFKPQPLDYLPNEDKSNEDSLININHRGLAEDADTKSKCSMTVRVTNNSFRESECVEPLRTSDLVAINTSALTHVESSRNANCVNYEDELVASFSEIGLSEVPSCNALSPSTKVSSNKSGRNKCFESLANGKLCGRISPCANDVALKIENNDLLSEQEIHGHYGVTDSVAKNNSFLDHFASRKLESSPESELPHFTDHQSDEESLIERGSNKGSKDQKREQTKLGRTLKAPKEELSRYLKHMSGGSVISVATNAALNRTSGNCDLLSLDYSSDQSSHYQESGPLASLPVYFDQNEICPIRQGIQGCHLEDVYSFTTSYHDGNLLDDDLSFSAVPSCSDSNSCASLPVESTESLGAQNQPNVHSRQCMSASDSLLEMYYPSPASEISYCDGQNSRSTTPESGYGSSPKCSYFSDDGAELCKYKDQSYANPSACLSNICSPSSCMGLVQSRDESVDNSDLSLIEENYSLSGLQHAEHSEEDKQRINVILQDLKKCEEYVKLNDVDMIRNVSDVQSICPDQLGSQNSPGFLCDTNASHLRGCSMLTNVTQHQEPSTCVNVPLQHQQESATSNSPQVILIYVPYAPKIVNKGQKNLKPILPKLEGQPAQLKTSKKRLLETLDGSKIKHHLYKIYEKLNNNDKNVICIENNETRQTNLHIAVITHQLELAYCILEIHKQYHKSMSAVNSRDIYKKTALQYAISNVMTVFVDYLKDFGAK